LLVVLASSVARSLSCSVDPPSVGPSRRADAHILIREPAIVCGERRQAIKSVVWYSTGTSTRDWPHDPHDHADDHGCACRPVRRDVWKGAASGPTIIAIPCFKVASQLQCNNNKCEHPHLNFLEISCKCGSAVTFSIYSGPPFDVKVGKTKVITYKCVQPHHADYRQCADRSGVTKNTQRRNIRKFRARAGLCSGRPFLVSKLNPSFQISDPGTLQQV
jgi:hypothetical protein